MPWREWELASLTENFNAMADRLGSDESPEWRDQWTAEIARLQGCEISA